MLTAVMTVVADRTSWEWIVLIVQRYWSQFLIGAGVTLLLLSPLPALVGAPAVLLGIAFAGLATLAFGALAREKIGGQTGDILGATQVLAEMAFLIGLLIGG